MKSITIIDDSILDAQLLKDWLEKDNHSQQINIYHSGIDALAHAEDIKPDIYIIDAQMPLLNGLDTAILILHRGYTGKILLISHAFYSECMVTAKKIGVSGYCQKEKQVVLSTLSKIEFGEMCFDHTHFAIWNTNSDINCLQQKDKNPKIDLLNPHHHKILAYSCTGLSTDEIGKLMNLKKHTVEQYRAAMLQLLEFTSLAQATAWAVASHIIKHGDVFVPPHKTMVK